MQRQVVFAAWRTNLTREQIEGTVLHGEQAAGDRDGVVGVSADRGAQQEWLIKKPSAEVTVDP